jgi:hypothetical protein
MPALHPGQPKQTFKLRIEIEGPIPKERFDRILADLKTVFDRYADDLEVKDRVLETRA